MNINSVRFRTIENVYKSNKVETKPKQNKQTDTLQISDLGKYLNEVNNKNKEINIEKVNEIKKKIENGTYNVDSKELAKKIISHMKGDI